MESEVPHSQRLLPGAPNQLQAMSNHFAQLLPAFSVANLGILIPALTENIPKHYLFSLIENNILIAILSIASSLFFYSGVQRSYYAQSHNILEMGADARKFFFNGKDPIEHCFGDNYEENEWFMTINGYMRRARSEHKKAIFRLTMGEISLLTSVSYVLFSYNTYMGIASFSLAVLYIAENVLKRLEQMPAWLQFCIKTITNRISSRNHQKGHNKPA